MGAVDSRGVWGKGRGPLKSREEWRWQFRYRGLQ